MVELWVILLAMGGGVVVGIGVSFMVAMLSDRSHSPMPPSTPPEPKRPSPDHYIGRTNVDIVHMSDKNLCVADSTPEPQDQCVADRKRALDQGGCHPCGNPTICPACGLKYGRHWGNPDKRCPWCQEGEPSPVTTEKKPTRLPRPYAFKMNTGCGGPAGYCAHCGKGLWGDERTWSDLCDSCQRKEGEFNGYLGFPDC